MPCCIECGEAILDITKVEHGVRVLGQCPICQQPCDTFAELDGVQKSIAILLLHTNAYRHVLFNIPNMVKPLVILVIISCMVESYVGLVQTSYLSFYKEHLHRRGGGSNGPPTLQYTAQMLLNQAVAQSATKMSDHASPFIASAAAGASYQSASSSFENFHKHRNDPFTDTDADMSDEKPREKPLNSQEELPTQPTPAAVTALANFLAKSPSLRLVHVLDVHQALHIVPFYSQLPLLFLYEMGEFVFLLLVVVWVGSALISKAGYPSIAKQVPSSMVTSPSASGSSQDGLSASKSAALNTPLYPESYRILLRAMALSTCSKMGYVLFLIWDMPLYLVILVEGYQFLILLTAVKGARASFKSALFVTVMCLGARYIFRNLLKSLPPFLASVALQLMVLRR